MGHAPSGVAEEARPDRPAVTPARWRFLRVLGALFLFLWSLMLGMSVHYFGLRFDAVPAIGLWLALGHLVFVALTLFFLKWVSSKYATSSPPPRIRSQTAFVVVGLAPVVAAPSPLSGAVLRLISFFWFFAMFVWGIDVLLDQPGFSLRRHLIFVLIVAAGNAAGMWDLRVGHYCHLRENSFAGVIQEMGQAWLERPPLRRSDAPFELSDSLALEPGKFLILEAGDFAKPTVSETELLLPKGLLAAEPSELEAVVLMGPAEPQRVEEGSGGEGRLRVTIYAWPERPVIFDRWVPFTSVPWSGPTLIQPEGQPRGYHPETVARAERLKKILGGDRFAREGG